MINRTAVGEDPVIQGQALRRMRYVALDARVRSGHDDGEGGALVALAVAIA